MQWHSLLTHLGTWTARPWAFLIVALYTSGWLLHSPETLEWHGVATLATWSMTLFIQRAEHRDTQAIHAKLDELLCVQGEARSDLTRLDEKEPEEIERFREVDRTEE
ncbi:low affinity iron permease family protein [Rhizobium cauense]|uniref:low affinity iron permease family protein n=1 Tax=Rhizobium cauense TaxID=1166683 RepID=UPI001C6E178C|nr:low affinity iron permease family protein [Rhizobium cauense]MBW9117680.1 low affinity iron permease family protein [Rhizobium cauense]